MSVSLGCGELSVSKTLNANISISGDCFRIVANHVLLDCGDFTISGNGSGIAVNVTGFNNFSMRNCVVSNFSTGFFDSSGNLTLHNLSFDSNSRVIKDNGILRISDSVVGGFNFSNITLSVAKTNLGELNFTALIVDARNTNLDSLIVFTNESIKVDSVIEPDFNVSAKLTFFPQNLADIEARVDFDDDSVFESCPSELCQNETTNTDTFIFDVAHFTSFGFGPVPSVPSAPSAPVAGGGGGGAGPKPKGPIDIEVVPEFIESHMVAGERKSFDVDIINGVTKREVIVELEGSEFLSFSNGARSLGVSLPAGEKWRVVLNVDLPENILGVHTGTVVVKGVNLEKRVSIRIVVGSGVILTGEEPDEVEEKSVQTPLVERPVRQWRRLIPFYPEPQQDSYVRSSAGSWILGSAIVGITIIVWLIIIAFVGQLKHHSLIRNVKVFFGRPHEYRKHRRLPPPIHLHHDVRKQ
ncbi:hypothetical protein HY484_04030 [Candidatus Woesearchaeota archaeon]|nr:hypothetical protein [Candidatus Woesearchaeota archaeon]